MIVTKFASAKELLDSLESKGFEIDFPINVDAIANELGINVIYSCDNKNPHTIGKIEFCDGKPIVTINPDKNSYEPRRRFTLAHEIAHYCLHANKTKGFVDTRKEMSRGGTFWDVYESEANTFAAQLLMPKNFIISQAKRIITHYKQENSTEKVPSSYFIDRMSDTFGVSSPAMEYRLRNIGII